MVVPAVTHRPTWSPNREPAAVELVTRAVAELSGLVNELDSKRTTSAKRPYR